MVTNKNARMLKSSCWYPSHIRTSPSCYITKSSSTNDFWYTSMSFLCCFGAWISTNIVMNFHFTQSHDGRLQIHRVTKCSFQRKNSCHPYSNQTLCSLYPLQNLNIASCLCSFFFVITST